MLNIVFVFYYTPN